MNIARFEGGPKDGGTFQLPTWPPPEKIGACAEGRYILISQSSLPDEIADHPNIARGCIYRWEEPDASS